MTFRARLSFWKYNFLSISNELIHKSNLHPMKKILSNLFFSAVITLGCAESMMAANSHFATGDLVLSFQKVGSTNTVYVDLGNAAKIYRGTAAGAADGVNQINFIDLNAKLNTAFSPTVNGGWKTDPEIYAGLAGVAVNESLSNTILDGDSYRTLYVSAARNRVGTIGTADSSAWTVAATGSSTSAAADILAQNNIFADSNSFNGYDAQIIISPTSISRIDDNQPITTYQGANYQGTAFSVFAGGIQQVGAVGTFGTFGAAGEVEFALDLYRIIGKDNATTAANGQVAGILRSGSYEGTVTVGSNGMVSFIAQDATLVVAPSITTQAIASTINNGASATFSVVAAGTSPTFQWYTGMSGDTAGLIVGATSATYTTLNLTVSTSYWVRVHNSAGDANSTAVIATVRSLYDSWMNGFPSITASANQLPSADPDKDGVTNLLESVLDGNPTISSTAILPILNITATDFIFSFKRRDDSENSTTLIFQYSTDLINWTSLPIGSSGGVTGNAILVVNENSTNPDTISVTLPKTVAASGKLYARLKLSAP